MGSHRHIWRSWVDKLHMWGVAGIAAALLETLGPLASLGAQAVYLVQPLFFRLDPGRQLAALAEMLDDGTQTAEFIGLLREETPL